MQPGCARPTEKDFPPKTGACSIRAERVQVERVEHVQTARRHVLACRKALSVACPALLLEMTWKSPNILLMQNRGFMRLLHRELSSLWVCLPSHAGKVFLQLRFGQEKKHAASPHRSGVPGSGDIAFKSPKKNVQTQMSKHV